VNVSIGKQDNAVEEDGVSPPTTQTLPDTALARLDSGAGLLEFERTKEIVSRICPARRASWRTSEAAQAATPGGWPGCDIAMWFRCTSSSCPSRPGRGDIETAGGDATELARSTAAPDALTSRRSKMRDDLLVRARCWTVRFDYATGSNAWPHPQV
jgi:hypothetical protein